jgi:hypothetical protein
MVHSTALRNAQADAFATLVDADAAGGFIKLRTGTSIGSGTLLATITLATTAFGSASSAVVTGVSFPLEAHGASRRGRVGLLARHRRPTPPPSAGSVCSTRGSVAARRLQPVREARSLGNSLEGGV